MLSTDSLLGRVKSSVRAVVMGTSRFSISSMTNAALDANDPAHDDDLKTAPV